MDYPAAPCEACGWANYFHLGQVAPAYAAVDAHATKRLRQWLCRKRKVKSGEFARSLVGRLWQDDGLERLKMRTASLAWAKGMISNESRLREIRTLGSLSGERKRGQGGA